jgi:hypothetical protein
MDLMAKKVTHFQNNSLEKEKQKRECILRFQRGLAGGDD